MHSRAGRLRRARTSGLTLVGIIGADALRIERARRECATSVHYIPRCRTPTQIGDLRMRLNWLLAFIPIALGLHWYGANPIVVFAASALALVPLAALMGEATDALADFVGPTWGGLLS